MSGSELNSLTPAAFIAMLSLCGCIVAPSAPTDSAGAPARRTTPVDGWPGSAVSPQRTWTQPARVPPPTLGLSPQPSSGLAPFNFLTGSDSFRNKADTPAAVKKPLYVGTLETLGNTVTLAGSERSFTVLDVIYDLESGRAVHSVLSPDSKTKTPPMVVPHSALRYDAEEQCFKLNLREEVLDSLPGEAWVAHLSKQPASIAEAGAQPPGKEPISDPYTELFSGQDVSEFKGTVQSVVRTSPEGLKVEYLYLMIRDPKNQYRRALIGPAGHVERVAPALEDVEIEVKGVLTRDKKGPLFVARSFQVKGENPISMRDESGSPTWSNAPEQETKRDNLPSKHYVLASRILGREQKNGVLSDIIFEGRTGELVFVKVKDYEFGPLLLPYSIITFVKDGGFEIDVGRDLLRTSPRIDIIPSLLDDPSWGERILRHYGLAPAVSQVPKSNLHANRNN